MARDFSHWRRAFSGSSGPSWALALAAYGGVTGVRVHRHAGRFRKPCVLPIREAPDLIDRRPGFVRPFTQANAAKAIITGTRASGAIPSGPGIGLALPLSLTGTIGGDGERVAGSQAPAAGRVRVIWLGVVVRGRGMDGRR